jgi:large subunit ribosomal protein L25
MKTLELKGQKRENTVKKGSKDLRLAEMVPCVIYGGAGTVHFSAQLDELKKFIYSPQVYFANIDVEGTSYKAVMREIQYHPVTDAVSHVDFYEVKEDKKVKVSLPVKVIGNSVGVRSGGRLAVNVRKLHVEALPKDLPDFIEIDITNMNIGDKLRISQMKVNGVTFLDAQNVVVAAVTVTRNTKSEETAEAKKAEAAPAAEEKAPAAEEKKEKKK